MVMIRAGLTCMLLVFQGSSADEVDFQDTPLLTSIWQATSSNDNDAIDRLFDGTSFAVNARSSDGRGPAWWAFEFQNTYVLASILANGGDPLSDDEDLTGQAASAMCEEPDCKTAELMEKAKAMVDDIKKRKEEREKAADDLDDDPDFDSEDSAAPSGDDTSFDDDEF
mmetsp:Transcript_13014/g.22684  ORF Transcript_13014/g.22684 Transcript_13014/m.22684 type:complete len:168 (-) Transcript_13014:56-559(-)